MSRNIPNSSWKNLYDYGDILRSQNEDTLKLQRDSNLTNDYYRTQNNLSMFPTAELLKSPLLNVNSDGRMPDYDADLVSLLNKIESIMGENMGRYLPGQPGKQVRERSALIAAEKVLNLLRGSDDDMGRANVDLLNKNWDKAKKFVANQVDVIGVYNGLLSFLSQQYGSNYVANWVNDQVQEDETPIPGPPPDLPPGDIPPDDFPADDDTPMTYSDIYPESDVPSNVFSDTEMRKTRAKALRQEAAILRKERQRQAAANAEREAFLREINERLNVLNESGPQSVPDEDREAFLRAINERLLELNKPGPEKMPDAEREDFLRALNERLQALNEPSSQGMPDFPGSDSAVDFEAAIQELETDKENEKKSMKEFETLKKRIDALKKDEARAQVVQNQILQAAKAQNDVQRRKKKKIDAAQAIARAKIIQQQNLQAEKILANLAPKRKTEEITSDAKKRKEGDQTRVPKRKSEQSELTKKKSRPPTQTRLPKRKREGMTAADGQDIEDPIYTRYIEDEENVPSAQEIVNIAKTVAREEVARNEIQQAKLAKKRVSTTNRRLINAAQAEAREQIAQNQILAAARILGAEKKQPVKKSAKTNGKIVFVPGYNRKEPIAISEEKLAKIKAIIAKAKGTDSIKPSKIVLLPGFNRKEPIAISEDILAKSDAKFKAMMDEVKNSDAYQRIFSRPRDPDPNNAVKYANESIAETDARAKAYARAVEGDPNYYAYIRNLAGKTPKRTRPPEIKKVDTTLKKKTRSEQYNGNGFLNKKKKVLIEVLQGEIKAGNNNPAIKRRLMDLLQQKRHN